MCHGYNPHAKILRVVLIYRPEDVAAACVTLLKDDDSNGDVIKILMNDKGEVIRHWYANDVNADPEALDSLVLKSRSVIAPIPAARKCLNWKTQFHA